MWRVSGDIRREGRVPGRRRHGRNTGDSGVPAAALGRSAGLATPPRSAGAGAGGPGVPRGPCGLGRRAPPPGVARTQAGVAGRLCRAVHARAAAHGEPRGAESENWKPPVVGSALGGLGLGRPSGCGLGTPKWSAGCTASLSPLGCPSIRSVGSGFPVLGESHLQPCLGCPSGSRAQRLGREARPAQTSSRGSRCGLHAVPAWSTSLITSV